MTPDSDRVLGKWMSTEKNLLVQVYKDGSYFQAKILWFSDKDDPSRPIETRVDYKNPDKNLRTRKLIGMTVLEDMVYVPKTNSWEGGKIYDAVSGRKWSSAAYINNKGELKVTGYWHFKWIGRTLTFTRAD
ncbi:DUF2147 domain-containing protein [Mucilaginibacter koreensis]